MVFALSHSARLLRSEYPVSRIWTINQPGAESDEQISLDDGPEYLLIWRQGFECRIELLSKDQWSLLSALQDDLDFQSLINETNLGDEIGQLIPEMVQKGWITGLELNLESGEEQ